MRLTSITEHRSRFFAINSQGERRVIDEYMRFTIIQPHSGPVQKLEGTRSLKLGRDHINALEDGTFEVERTGEILRLEPCAS